MTNFEKLKSMTWKELYNFFVLNGVTVNKSCYARLFTELQLEDSTKVIVKIIQDFPRRDRCVFCALKGKPCYALCAEGIEGFLKNTWKGYKII